MVRLLFLLQSYLCWSDYPGLKKSINPGGSEFYSFLIYDSDKGFWEGAGKATARFGHYGLIGPEWVLGLVCTVKNVEGWNLYRYSLPITTCF